MISNSIACYPLATRQHNFDDKAEKALPLCDRRRRNASTAIKTIFDKKTPQGN
jgi:hypothetical protein